MFCRIALLLLCFLALSGCPTGQPLIQRDMQALIAYLDSPAYSDKVSWPEHIVMAYRLAQGRDPSPVEFALIQALRHHPGLNRSDVFGIALAGDGEASWDKCAALLARKDGLDFTPDAAATKVAERLFGTPPERIAEELDKDVPDSNASAPEVKGTELPGQNYNTYFGFLHAHSHLSLDAEGTPDEAYAEARASGMDFFSLSDHAEFFLIWPWDRKWDQAKAAAAAADSPGEFVALHGFEWSNPFLGHCSVINTEEYTHTLKSFTLNSFYDWLADRPEGFAQYNHPGDYDFLGVELRRFRYHPRVASQMVGVELWNTNASFDDYYYGGSWESELPYYDVGLQQGWRLGALGAQDNHHGEWGSLNDFRTGVLATELTRGGIAEALRARRIYATEDKDLHLDFRYGGYPMGSTVQGTGMQFVVRATDASGDNFQQVRLLKNGLVTDTRELSGNEVNILFEPTPQHGEGYYYIIITQSDDNDNNGRNDEAISSPIWVEP